MWLGKLGLANVVWQTCFDKHGSAIAVRQLQFGNCGLANVVLKMWLGKLGLANMVCVRGLANVVWQMWFGKCGLANLVWQTCFDKHGSAIVV